MPALEWREEVTAILLTKKGNCGFALSTTEFFLGQPRWLVDGGKLLKCGEVWPLSDRTFVACECEVDAQPAQ